jgi:hypothetical protein
MSHCGRLSTSNPGAFWLGSLTANPCYWLYTAHHITVRHGVAAEQFEETWVDRVDLVVRPDDSYESVGATNDGQEL